MALKKNPNVENELVMDESISGQKAKELFSNEPKKRKKENKVLTTFSIEPSFKRELEELFQSMGLAGLQEYDFHFANCKNMLRISRFACYRHTPFLYKIPCISIEKVR